jgi:hypothetical protein
MTTSAPQWPGQEGIHEPREEERDPPGRQSLVPPSPVRGLPGRVAGAGPSPAQDHQPATYRRPPLRAVPDGTVRRLQPLPSPSADTPTAPAAPPGTPPAAPPAVPPGAPPAVPSVARLIAASVARPEVPSAAPPLVPSVAPSRGQAQRRPVGRRGRFVVVRDATERELRVARRRARANLPSPAAVTRDIALALLEVEAGCRSAAQLERVVSRELWEVLEQCIGRRGGPLPSGRSVMSVRCQEDTPGLADTVAVVRKGDLVRPIALRLDASGGRWVVTELRWWRNETDTATTPGRDGGSP